MIEARDLCRRHGGRPVLTGVTLTVRPGEFTVLLGPNGAGKSTLLTLLTGETAPDHGRVTLDGRALSDLSPAALARRRAVLPQASELAFPFTVGEVVGLGLEAGGHRVRPEAVRAALARVELSGFAGRLYGELSGGEQQRVHLARVLAQTGGPVGEGGPRFLFLDEPVSSLDIRHQIAVLEIARDFARGGGGVLAVLHDLNLAAGFADRLVVLSGGRIAGEGRPSAVLDDALIESVFGLRLRVGALPPPGMPFLLPQTAAL
ncbi:heme ABC transporter ATP-binding protein [Aureimonas sp. SK2]|uniref:heme ABC transporter ATP-binding protein n=1 Tax=Aureimonas sp. SK2 TaxID=3015992 RepID=UPI0024452EB5|nr:heme ABC transporter ATP-binding protein [Aureimonas sp. SK2]